ncbi:MAG: DUF167 domain-containing protein [Nitrospirota bacterium]
MKISVTVKPNAKQEKIEKVGEKDFIVWVKEKPQEGKANQAVIRVVAEYFNVPKSEVILLKGQTAREKVFEIKKT